MICGDLHWLCVWAFSGDNALFVHQHLSEGAHFLSDLFFCVPEDMKDMKDTTVSEGTQTLMDSDPQLQ